MSRKEWLAQLLKHLCYECTKRTPRRPLSNLGNGPELARPSLPGPLRRVEERQVVARRTYFWLFWGGVIAAHAHSCPRALRQSTHRPVQFPGVESAFEQSPRPRESCDLQVSALSFRLRRGGGLIREKSQLKLSAGRNRKGKQRVLWVLVYSISVRMSS